mmetsp:Transcript_1763/g.2876  ORF Transcript_1763/g.2876 Transcript_1763/m.2876 type:complete len:126 (-) Transcript_1763:1436-1813(-)
MHASASVPVLTPWCVPARLALLLGPTGAAETAFTACGCNCAANTWLQHGCCRGALRRAPHNGALASAVSRLLHCQRLEALRELIALGSQHLQLFALRSNLRLKEFAPTALERLGGVHAQINGKPG